MHPCELKHLPGISPQYQSQYQRNYRAREDEPQLEFTEEEGSNLCVSTAKASRCLTNPPIAPGEDEAPLGEAAARRPIKPSPGRAQLQGRQLSTSTRLQPCVLQVPAAALTEEEALLLGLKLRDMEGADQDCSWDSRYDEHEISVLARPGALAGDTPAHDADDVPSEESEPPSPGSSYPAQKNAESAGSVENHRSRAILRRDNEPPSEPHAAKPLPSCGLSREPSDGASGLARQNSNDFECADDLVLSTASESLRLHRDTNSRVVPTRG